MMKEPVSRLTLVLADGIGLFFSIILAFFTRQLLEPYFDLSAPANVLYYLQFWLVYVVTFVTFYFLGIYRKRYDFWQELERIIKGLFLSAVVILSVLAMTKQAEDYSRFILIAIFVYAAMIIPLQKNGVKRVLFQMKLWQKEAKLIGRDPFFSKHVFTNPYLGYVRSKRDHAKTLFVSSSHSKDQIEKILHDALLNHQEVIFIPAVKNFDFSDAHIIHLFNARANLILVENNLLDSINRTIKTIIDYALAMLLLPILLLGIGIISFLIKREDGGSVFFKQIRLGEGSKEFYCYKFRSMKENGEPLLATYLQEHPEEITNYETYHKYENDPRITKIGSFLRKTSLDELPQIFNVLKGEMSLIGPRPYMGDEKIKIGDKADMILSVKPGITGLWQVSGRSDIDFQSRVEIDVWYVRNWSIWNDIVILIKTVQVVLLRKGSY
ncbi:exopolysaccharide biosynthesis polyprenyl glycosylphosphotransferase [Sulfuricurvum sp. UBA5598]|nr:exopolysaccharide biosynthesis polyprenyl glycosylphosphotransferase [Sulfuricurvum sp. UBA5598]